MCVAGLGRVTPEVTYMKMCVVLGKALALHRAVYPHIDVEQAKHRLHDAQGADPRAAEGSHPFLKGSAIPYTAVVAQRCMAGTSSRKDVSCNSVAEVCIQSLRAHVAAEPGHATWAGLRDECASDTLVVLKYATTHVFRRCQFEYFLASSQLAVNLLSSKGKSEASSYRVLRDEDDQGYATVCPALIQYIVMVQWHHLPEVERWAKVWKLPVVTDEIECESFGRTVFRADISTELNSENEAVVPVSDILRPFILIKVPPESSRVMCRLVQFQGRLLGSCE
jgi:hypothetical protein